MTIARAWGNSQDDLRSLKGYSYILMGDGLKSGPELNYEE